MGRACLLKGTNEEMAEEAIGEFEFFPTQVFSKKMPLGNCHPSLAEGRA
jgi:hypothetical protein